MNRTLTSIVLTALFLFPHSAGAFEVSGWVPYWSGSKGTREAAARLDVLDIVMPFSYSVKADGTLKDEAGMRSSSWKRLMRSAASDGTLVIPTVMAFDGARIHSLLSNEKKREAHIEEIVSMVEKGHYDGVDIDYEGKRASTRPYFSVFLHELKDALGKRILSCTIEARTPPESLYREVPEKLEYANDLAKINEACDRVNVMAYDQQRADLTLNSERKGAPYIPVADAAWVEKVLKYMKRDIDANKLVLGVPTYGAEWELTVAPEWYMSYKKLWSLNPSYAEETAEEHNIRPGRNAAGERSFTYLPKSSKKTVGHYDAPRGTPEWNEAAAQALAYANTTGKNTIVHVVWWSDAEAITEKIALARKLGIAGIAIFKLDGSADDGFWNAL